MDVGAIVKPSVKRLEADADSTCALKSLIIAALAISKDVNTDLQVRG